jgi:hypothetical protein
LVITFKQNDAGGDEPARSVAKAKRFADFQKATALAEQIAGADPNNADWEQVLLWSEWRLSEQGDASATRLGDMTARMRKLKTENRLSADLVRLLPIAEGRWQSCMLVGNAHLAAPRLWRRTCGAWWGEMCSVFGLLLGYPRICRCYCNDPCF